MEYENNSFEPEVTQCPICEPEEIQTVADKVLPALKDPKFLAICILTSASCLISLCFGSIPIINILIAVFLWLTYAQSRKGITDVKHLRCLSGTIYAEYILAYVTAGLLVCAGVMIAFVFSFLYNSADIGSLTSELSQAEPGVAVILGLFSSLSAGLILFIFIFAAGITVIFNLFTTRYLHRFVKSVYKSIEANTLELKHANAAKIFLYILSGFSALSALTYLGAPLTLLSHGSNCAAALLSALLIQKYFIAE